VSDHPDEERDVPGTMPALAPEVESPSDETTSILKVV
jgi:hypothetical protein